MLTRGQYHDVARLLNVYQLWLDELYPRAKFADGLAIIEKLGHTKRLQAMRREWINEGKPSESLRTSEIDLQKSANEIPMTELSKDIPSIRVSSERPKTPSTIGDIEDDDLYAATTKQADKESLLKRLDSGSHNPSTSIDEAVGDLPLEDDLGALMAEVANPTSKRTGSPTSYTHNPREEQNFDDEMEAMRDMDDMW